jgi:hypothetical protein
MKRTRNEHGFWQKHLDQWRTSGLTQEAYCRRYDLSYSSFARNRNRISRERKAGNVANVSFIPVTVKPEPMAAMAVAPDTLVRLPPTSIEVRLANGRSIVLSHGCDEAWLGRVICFLEALPC